VLLQGVPGLLDGHGLHRAQFSFFVVAVGVFFNVHHIFLDNVLWRLGEDRDVRQALMT
jgi:hypothetical protein